MINKASHSAEFFRSLLHGRVWIRRGRSGVAVAHLLSRAGRLTACFLYLAEGVHVLHESATTIRPSPAWLAAIVGSREGRPTYLTPIYDPGTGRLHVDLYSPKKNAWRAGSPGWVQETFPLALWNACPPLDLPEGMEVNRKQDSTDFEEMKAADPDAPIRNFPGSELRVLGAGLGASGNKPTVTIEQIKAFLSTAHGMVFKAPALTTVAMVVSAERGDEYWKLDGDGDVVDVATIKMSADEKTVDAHWRGSGKRFRYHVGYPVPLLPTGRQYPAFRMMDELAAAAKPVPLPMGAREIAVRFSADGRATSPGGEGDWWLSAGRLHVQVPERLEPSSWPWREAARLAGWTPPPAASDPGDPPERR